MRQLILISSLALICSLSPLQSPVWAAGEVQLELVGDARSTALTFQDWAQALGSAGIKNFRLRAGQETDKVGIEVQGTAEHPLYIVTGQVLSRDQLQLPGARFKRSEVKRLAQWLDDLAQYGPPDKRPKKVAFGLTAEQLDRVKKDLAAPVGFSTKGLSRRDAVEKIARKLSLSLKFEDGTVRSLADDKVQDELSKLSCGTALAYLLRPAGYCFAPQAAGGQIEYVVFKARGNLREIWPVGRPPEKTLPEILPGLFEFRHINVQNVSAATALEAIGKRLQTPVLYDHAALAKHAIDPAKAIVNLPGMRTNYSLALGRMLFPAGLKFEVRLDEAGAPFLWIFTVKPVKD
jgi:hypothetical protein